MPDSPPSSTAPSELSLRIGPWAHQPSGRFSSNAAWTVLAAITHNLLRAAGTLAAPHLGKARGATLRRQIINVPARIARPQGRRILHLPAHWPHADSWKSLWNNTCHHSRQVTA